MFDESCTLSIISCCSREVPVPLAPWGMALICALICAASSGGIWASIWAAISGVICCGVSPLPAC